MNLKINNNNNIKHQINTLTEFIKLTYLWFHNYLVNNKTLMYVNLNKHDVIQQLNVYKHVYSYLYLDNIYHKLNKHKHLYDLTIPNITFQNQNLILVYLLYLNMDIIYYFYYYYYWLPLLLLIHLKIFNYSFIYLLFHTFLLLFTF